MKYKMDKIWVKTLARLDDFDKRIKHIESLALPHPIGETFPEQQHRKAREEIEGHNPDREFKGGVEQKPEQRD